MMENSGSTNKNSKKIKNMSHKTKLSKLYKIYYDTPPKLKKDSKVKCPCCLLSKFKTTSDKISDFSDVIINSPDGASDVLIHHIKDVVEAMRTFSSQDICIVVEDGKDTKARVIKTTSELLECVSWTIASSIMSCLSEMDEKTEIPILTISRTSWFYCMLLHPHHFNIDKDTTIPLSSVDFDSVIEDTKHVTREDLSEIAYDQRHVDFQLKIIKSKPVVSYSFKVSDCLSNFKGSIDKESYKDAECVIYKNNREKTFTRIVSVSTGDTKPGVAFFAIVSFNLDENEIRYATLRSISCNTLSHAPALTFGMECIAKLCKGYLAQMILYECPVSPPLLLVCIKLGYVPNIISKSFTRVFEYTAEKSRRLPCSDWDTPRDLFQPFRKNKYFTYRPKTGNFTLFYLIDESITERNYGFLCSCSAPKDRNRNN